MAALFTLFPLSPLRSTRRFHLRSLLFLSCSYGTSPMWCRRVFSLTGPTSLFPTRSSPLPSYLLPLSSPLLPLPCCVVLHSAPLPPPMTSLGLFCPLPPPRPARLHPCPCLPISPVRTNMSETGRAGVIHLSQLRAGPQRTWISLTGPLPWWGTASAVPCPYTASNSSTLCTVRRRSGTRTPCRTVLW